MTGEMVLAGEGQAGDPAAVAPDDGLRETQTWLVVSRWRRFVFSAGMKDRRARWDIAMTSSGRARGRFYEFGGERARRRTSK